MILNICTVNSLQRNNYREQEILQIEDREDRETNLNPSIRQFNSFNPFEIYNASCQEIPRIAQLFSPRLEFRQMKLKRERKEKK